MRQKFIGSAGSGKTRTIIERLSELVRDPHEVSFASLTNAAKDEITSRICSLYGTTAESLAKANWRTTHSMALRSTGLGDDLIYPGTADYDKFCSKACNVPLAGFRSSDAADALQLWDLARMAGKPLRNVHRTAAVSTPGLANYAKVASYVRQYEAAKRRDTLVDVIDPLMRFCGITMTIEGKLDRVRPDGDVPDDIRVLVLDEAQDASFLIYEAQRRLEVEGRPEHLILAADPYQSIFGFLGGDPRFFLDWEVDETVTMPRSWRCAPDIFALGQRCLRGTAGYVDYGISPADHAGKVSYTSIVRQAVEAAGDGSVMVLARTRQIAADISAEIDEPTATIGGGADTLAAKFRTLHDLQNGRIVSAADMVEASKQLNAKGFFERGLHAKWKRGEVSVDEVVPWRLSEAGFSEGGVGLIASGKWVDAVKDSTAAAKWQRAVEQHGVEVACRPRILVGTIHSSKGLEADGVILATELPETTMKAITRFREARDEEMRVSYVGVTRARKNLVVLNNPVNARRAKWVRSY
jgi:superfamily I DNA/RNA helicase